MIRFLTRRGTDATLVSAPKADPGPVKCFSGILGRFQKNKKKRASSISVAKCEDELDGCHDAIDKPRPRRGDSGLTIAVLGGEKGEKFVHEVKEVDRILELNEDEEERRYVSSPISETSSSSPFTNSTFLPSPSSIPTELPPLTPPTSPDTPSIPLPRSFLHDRPPVPEKRGGGESREKKETVRSVTILAARTLVNVAEASNIPYLKGIAGLAALIIEYTDGASENKEDCEQIKGRVEELAKMVVLYVAELETDPSLHQDLRGLVERLKIVRDCAKKLACPSRAYIQRFLRQEEDRESIRRAEKELDHAFAVFNLQSSMFTRSALVGLGNSHKKTTDDIKEQLDEIRKVMQRGTTQHEMLDSGSSRIIIDGELFDEPKDITHASAAGTHSLRMSNSQRTPCQSALERAAASARPPPSRKIFYGRDKDLQKMVDMVTENTASHIAVLGPGGIGKSTLSTALLNNKFIIDKFGKYRFFISCDSATSAQGLTSVIASHLGVSESKNGWRGTVDTIKTVLSGASLDDKTSASFPEIGPSCLMVLDNFETPWEPPSGRKDVEDLLALLTEVDGLTLVITLRGVERPGGVTWTKPFLPVLQTLESTDARRMFLAITDADFPESTDEDDRDELDELLGLCGYLPLAVQLAARLAQPELETVSNLIKRWTDGSQSIRILSDGDDRETNLEASIELSLNSPRLQQKPGARVLLGILSLLPDGLRMDDLRLAAPDLQDANKCSDYLRKTSLAYVDSRNRIRVLAPIRSYMSSTHPPGKPMIKKLEDYFWGMFKAADRTKRERNIAPVRRVVEELGNIESLIIRALKDFDPTPAIQAIIDLGRFYLQTSVGKPPLLAEALQFSREVGNKKQEADCMLIAAAIDVYLNYGNKDAIESDIKRAEKLYEEIDDKRGQADCMHRLGRQYHNLRRFDECEKVLESALKLYEETNDVPGQASTLVCLGRKYRIASEPEKSMDVAKRAFDLANSVGDDLYMPIIRGQALQQMGDICHIFMSHYTKAREYFNEVLTIHEDLGLDESPNYASVLSSLGEVYLIFSEFQNAQEIFEQVISLFRRMGVNDRAAYALNKLSMAYLGMGLTQEAMETIEKADTLWNKVNNDWGKGITMIAKGDIYLSQNDHSAAEVYYEQARSKIRADSKFWDAFEAECLFKLGMLRKGLGQRDAALAYFRNALSKYQVVKQKIDETSCLRQISELMLDNAGNGNREEHDIAIGYLQEAHQRYMEMGLDKEKVECDQLLVARCRPSSSRPPLDPLQV